MLITFVLFYYLKKIIYYEYQIMPALKPYEMRGEKDLLDNLVNFSSMAYFPHCFKNKCIVKFGFKDSIKV